ncbi:MAG: UDPglucose 6-dehydrogenase [Parcubacteria group bacterium Gr01-1014_30]|nr:MAG: UDPglucose 6-dehydrogenase [Parcubacteria group bacterium Gr01-1014_30]
MSQASQQKIGVAGVGYVGGAVKHWFETQGLPLFLYDKGKGVGSLEELNKAEVVFLCLPTPFDEKSGFSDSAIWEVLKGLEGEKVVVVKSTVLPGSTDKYQASFPQHKILFNPEFLTEKNANQDFINPKRQLVGYTKESTQEAEKVMAFLPKAHFQRIMEAKAAEMVKYFGNLFLANRVIFANQMYDVCEKLGIDYDAVKEAAGEDSRVGNSHFDVFSDGYRGYSRSCLPKDTKAFIQLAESLGLNPRLLKTIDEVNERFIFGDKNYEW